MNNNIKRVEIEGQEHKLLLYADDILAVVSNPLTSLPHLMDTIQLYSKCSGYTINWNKSEAMPLSKSCYSHMVEKFKWVPKGMTYLGIRLSQNLDELPLLNFNPVLGKIKANLEKWEKIRLTLWGKVNIVKISVAPQFNYLVMMLPITIPPDIFKRYDNIIKHFLWEGKKVRIKLSKLCAPKEKGRNGVTRSKIVLFSI